MKKYEYRRQFIAGPHFWGEKEYWKHIDVSREIKLSVHRDLPLTVSQKGGTKIFLLGYMIDPSRPELTDSDIVERLLESEDLSRLINNTYGLSGRWILIFLHDNQIFFLHDAFGMRQIYYTNEEEEFWCGSQPSVLAECLKLKPDYENKALTAFIQSKEFESKEGFWVGDKTRFRELRHLLPNHYLNASTGATQRYWVNKKLPLSVEEAAEHAGEILKHSLIAANKRYQLMMPVTAGWDSRALFAASKEIRDDLFYFISTKNHLNEEDDDIRIPKKMLGKLNLDFHVLDHLKEPEEDFLRLLKKNVDLARNLPKTLTFYEFYLHHQDKVNINGRGAETARSYYAYDENPGIEFLAKVTGYPDSSFVKTEISNWLQDARPFASKKKIDLTDLYYWEQRMGNWGGTDPAEQDIALEEFCPFNNRKLMMILLSTERKYRIRPSYRLHKKIIAYLWKEVLTEPINPIPTLMYVKMLINSKISQKIKSRLRKLLRIYPYD